MAPNIRRLASRDQVSIRLYDVIYELIDDVKTELTKLLPDEIVKRLRAQSGVEVLGAAIGRGQAFGVGHRRADA